MQRDNNNANATTADSGGSSGDVVSSSFARHPHHHNHHRSGRRVLEIDGSTLQVPGNDGFYRLLFGPAAVVASRLPPPNSDTTTNVSSSGGSGGEAELPPQETLLEPHREPGYHTIRKTFSKLPKRGGDVKLSQRSSAADSSSTVDEAAAAASTNRKSSRTTSKHQDPTTTKLPPPSSSSPTPKTKKIRKRETVQIRFQDPVDGRESPSPDSVGSSNGAGEGSSSGSGTEGGYAGSASSNENSGQQESSSSSSPSVSSSEDSHHKSKRHHHHRHHRHHHHRSLRTKGSKRSSSEPNNGDYSSSSSSSEIADFSSGASILNEEQAVGLSIDTFDKAPSNAMKLSNEESLDDLEETYLHAKKAVVEDQVRFLKATAKKRKSSDARTWSRKSPRAKWPRPNMENLQQPQDITLPARGIATKGKRAPILRLGSDVMAHVLTFLHPPDILDVLTMPLSKEWRQTFTLQPELWRVLCLVEPFKARMQDSPEDDSDTSDESCQQVNKGLLDRYRLLYSSFVRCMKYLSQIRDDALNGREPTFIDYGGIAERGRNSKRGPPTLLGSNRNLQLFLARARGVLEEAKSHSSDSSSSSSSSSSISGGESDSNNGKMPSK